MRGRIFNREALARAGSFALVGAAIAAAAVELSASFQGAPVALRAHVHTVAIPPATSKPPSVLVLRP